MVEPSSLADTVTPPSFSPDADVIAPLKQLVGGLRREAGDHKSRTCQENASHVGHDVVLSVEMEKDPLSALLEREWALSGRTQ